MAQTFHGGLREHGGWFQDCTTFHNKDRWKHHYRVNQLVQSDRSLTLQMISEKLSLNTESADGNCGVTSHGFSTTPTHAQLHTRQLVRRDCWPKTNSTSWPPSLFPKLGALWFLAFSKTKSCDERDSFFVSERNRSLNDERALETQPRVFHQVLLWVVGLHAKVHWLRGEVC